MNLFRTAVRTCGNPESTNILRNAFFTYQAYAAAHFIARALPGKVIIIIEVPIDNSLSYFI